MNTSTTYRRWLLLPVVFLLAGLLVSSALAASRSATPQASAYAQSHPSHLSPQLNATITPPILEEHFDGASFPPPGWTVVNHGGACVWSNEAGEPYPEGNLTAGFGGFADADSDACGPGTTMDTSLVSPLFDLSSAPAGVGLEFASDFNAWGGQIASVEISNSLVLTWTSIWTTSGTTLNEFVRVDLSAFIGYPNNRIRFHFKSPGWNYWWQVDDVMVAPPMPDLEIHHDVPVYWPAGTPIPYTITVQNVGNMASVGVTLTNLLMPEVSYITGSLSCTGATGLCTYDSINHEIRWTGAALLPSDGVTLTFLVSPTAPNQCDYVHNWTFVDDSSGVHLETLASTEIMPQVLYYTDFENRPDGYGSGDWAWGTPNWISAPRGPADAYNGRMLWGTNLNGPYGGNATLAIPLDLRTISFSQSGIMLFWKEWVDINPTSIAQVRILSDTYPISGGSARTWNLEQIELTPYLGQMITVTFELTGPPNYMAAYSGWYLDSLAVTEGCPYAVVGWSQSTGACPGDSVPYHLYAQNTTHQSQNLTLSVSGNAWPTVLNSSSATLLPGDVQMFTATVQVPLSVTYGAIDNAYILGIFSPEPATNNITLTTWVGDHWVEEMPLPLSGPGGAAVSYNNQTYYFPGAITETFRYDPGSGMWSPLAGQPAPAYATNQPCYGSDAGGNPVVVLFPNVASTGTDLHIYHILSDTWSLFPLSAGAGLPPFPLDGMAVAADPANNVCYLSGGMNTNMVYTDTLYAFFPADNTFNVLSPMSTPRAYHASWVTSDGRACVAGGSNGVEGALLDSTQCYDPGTNAWEAENTSFGHLPIPLWGMAQAQLAPDEVWLMGGSQAPDYGSGPAEGSLQDTFFWDSIGLTWTYGARLPYPVSLASADVQNGVLYLMGGVSPWGPESAHQRLRTCNAQAPVEADIWLQKYADPPVVAINTPFTYTLEVGNNGPAQANNVIVEDYLPPGVTVTLPTMPPCTAQTGVFTCTLGSIPPGGVTYIQVQATSVLIGVQLNQAVAYSTEPDPDSGNNIAAAQSYFMQQAVTAPIIFDVTPSSGANISPTVIAITGMNFNPGLSVELGSQSLTHIRRNNRLINAIVPAGLSPGSYDISVINPDGQSDTAVQAFTVYTDNNPKVYGIFPEDGTNDMPAGIIIVGENFAPGAVAVLSGTLPVKAGAPFTVTLGSNYFINGNILVSVVPKNLPPLTYDLMVVNPNGKYAVLPQAYTVIDSASLDLYGRHGDLWTAPHTVRAGDTITVGATVRRTGGLSTTLSNVDVAFYIGDPSSGTPITIGFGSTGPILPRDTGVATTTLDLTGVPPGFYDLYAVIDPADSISEFDESNNILTYTLAVLPQTADNQPPSIAFFRINNGAQSTNDVRVSLELSATDNTAPAYMFYIEYTYLPALGFWWPVQLSGWQAYQEVTPAALYATPGVHYAIAWVADAAGNISDPQTTWINLMQPGTPIAQYEVHPYRLRLHAGDSVHVRLTSGTGDADLYVFGPDDSLIGSSENSTPVDEVLFTASQDGVYQIEVEGYAASSTYTLEILPGAAPSRQKYLPPEDRTPSKPASPLRGRGSPILSVGEEPSSSIGLDNVPDTLYTISLPLIMR
ncbi:MAG: hypothetical protein Fur0018_19880 [Anaerolineales bacterium]